MRGPVRGARRPHRAGAMQCPTCESEVGDAAMRCPACGSALSLACPRCGCANSPARRFCAGCGRPLSLSRTSAGASHAGACAADGPLPLGASPGPLGALDGEAKPVTVLFLDIQDSMQISERLGPEAWHVLLDRFFRRAAAAIREAGGTVNQYTGDGVMALFGAPIAHEDHALRACAAALALRDDLRRFGDEAARQHGVRVAVRMGLNSGDVVVGRIGDDLRSDYTAQGQSVGLAERMQRIAPPGEAVMTAATASLVEGFFELEALGPTPAKGAGEPVHAFRLIGPSARATRLERSARRGLTRFVGREREMAMLEALAASIRPGRGWVVGVVGPAGVGKSRLCEELAARRRALGWIVHEVHGLAHRREVAGLALAELARSVLGDGGAAAPAIAATRAASGESGLDGAEPAASAGASDPGGQVRALARAVADETRASAHAQPLLVLLDDAHWMDETSLAALEDVVATAAASAALVLVNFRPGFVPPGARRSDYQQIALLPLDDGASDALVTDLLGTHPSLGALAEALRERAAGNPFFLEEMIRALVQSGALAGERGERRLLREVDVLAVPSDVRALLAARLDRLAERDKHVLEAAAVIGRRFDAALLARVAGLSPEETEDALRSLERSELVRDEGGDDRQYGFEHPLVQEVAYRAQLANQRGHTHARVARALEDLYADRLGEVADLLSHHWEAAGRASTARRWHRLAALRVTRIQLGRH